MRLPPVTETNNSHLTTMLTAPRTVLLSILLTLPAIPAHKNTALLSQFNPGNTYNEIWGYTSPTGGEYAILGAVNGTYIVDCSNPPQPVQRAFIPGPNSNWRDMKTNGSYLYVVTEGGGGCQIIDLANPNSPRLVKTWGATRWRNAHNVQIDTETNTMYVCGTNVGMPIFDISNPLEPTPITTFSGGYVHDLHVQNGRAHLAMINNSRYEAWDVSELPTMTRLGSLSISSAHNAWASRDDSTVIVTSETFGGGLTVVDMNNPRLPRSIATWIYNGGFGGSFTSIHNGFLVDRVLHVGNYIHGYRVVDLSNPSNPVEIADYDTSQSLFGYAGAWGAYPYQPSGVIYVSDMESGLYVLSTPASTARYGNASAPSNGAAPTIHPFGAAWAGNNRYALTVEGAPANARVALVIGQAPGSVTIAGVELLVDLSRPHIVVNLTANADGTARLDLPIPGNAPTTELVAQGLVFDASATLGLTGSRGMRFSLFRR